LTVSFLKEHWFMGVRRGGQNEDCPPWKLELRSKNFWKT